MLHFVFAFMVSAHAGLLKNICDRCFSALVMDCPYDYDGVSTEYAVRSLDALCTAKQWRALNAHEQHAFDSLVKELTLRTMYGPDKSRDLADEALIRCAR